MSPLKKKILHWAFFVGTVVILVVLYTWLTEMKIQAKIDSGTLYDSVEFYYDDNFSATLKEMPDNKYYVYLPSFADISNLNVKIENAKVNFMTETETISVYANKKNSCSFMPDIEYVMVFYDNKDNVVGEITVVFMVSANLPTVYITTESGTFEKLDDNKAYSENAVF